MALSRAADVLIGEWTEFYQKVFGIKVDFSGVKIPAKRRGFGWVVIVHKGLTLNQVWAKCKELFLTDLTSYFGDDLDKAITKNNRTSKIAYARRFRSQVEADKELVYLSARALRKRGIKCITLLERLLLEIWHFSCTGEHLDRESITFCAGSRNDVDDIPGVFFGGKCVNISRYDDCDPPDNRLRGRAAI